MRARVNVRASVRIELGERASLEEPRHARFAPAVRRLEHQGREALHLARDGLMFGYGLVGVAVAVREVVVVVVGVVKADRGWWLRLLRQCVCV